jgi:hypothetical protein
LAVRLFVYYYPTVTGSLYVSFKTVHLENVRNEKLHDVGLIFVQITLERPILHLFYQSVAFFCFAFMCFISFSLYTAIISLKYINQFICVVVMFC